MTVLCGSSRFADHIRAEGARLALQGHVVLGAWTFITDLDDRTARLLVAAHRHMIRMADEVVVVAPGGYIGAHTRDEIEYAETLGRPVRVVDPTAAAPL